MQGIEKKIIRASAGTGKTYRLSLEYIGLLLKYQAAGVDFSEILVITFTRKATAEIRERIFDHLAEIISNAKGKRAELENNLRQATGIAVGETERKILREAYLRMTANKNLVQISTIDSFTNQIFKTVIGPYLGILDYEIAPKNDEAILAEIYQTMLAPDNLKLLEDFYFRTGKRQIADFKNLVSSIIDERWIFDLMDETEGEDYSSSQIDDFYLNFRKDFDDVLDRLQNYINADETKRGQSAKNLLRKDFYLKFFEKPEAAPAAEIAYEIKKKLDDKDFLLKNYAVLLPEIDNYHFWNGQRIYGKNGDAEEKAVQLQTLKQALRYFADWLFSLLGTREAKEIREISRRILERYDEIKFREKKFTYNDVSYYTFKYLYSPELSLIEDGAVSNQFYEYLTGKIRFILIDEFQDTSVIQYKILYPMIREVISGSGVKDYGGVIVVGDEKQSIYGWRGGERDLLLNLDASLQGAEAQSLRTSFRSERRIINFVNDIFGNENLKNILAQNNIVWPYEKISDNKKENHGYLQAHFANKSKTVNGVDPETAKRQFHRSFLTEKIVPLINEGKLNLSTTAILARKNQDLEFAASVLDELDVPNISESSLSILNHPAIKPLLYFYQFLVYRDFYDLLAFLRSDYSLMPGEELRELLDIYRHYKGTEFLLKEMHQKASHLPAFEKIWSFLNDIGFFKNDQLQLSHQKPGAILSLTKRLLEHYGVNRIFAQESDLKNIHLFMEIIAAFENDRQNYTHDLRGFLKFCQDLESDESFRQAGLEAVEAIRLLTIHKAKGLEFENVILLWDLSGKGGHDHGKIRFYPEYRRDYNSLKRFALTYNFDKVLPFSSRQDLVAATTAKDAIEVMNLLYVAMTRAKANLFLFFDFEKSTGLEKFFEESKGKGKPRVDVFLAELISAILLPLGQTGEEKPNIQSYESGSLTFSQNEQDNDQEPEFDFSIVKSYLDFDKFEKIVPAADETAAMSRGEVAHRFIYERTLVKGDIAHYYLSFIKFDSPRARKIAADRTVMKYGGLLAKEKIEKIIVRTNEFLDENSRYFSSREWDAIFTEWTIFPNERSAPESYTGGQLRIDRLMVNRTNKQIMILDYKSGEVRREEQIEIYKKIVEELPAVKSQGFSVQAKYVKLDLMESN